MSAKRLDAEVVKGDNGYGGEEENWRINPNLIPADSPVLKSREDVFVDFDPFSKARSRTMGGAPAAWIGGPGAKERAMKELNERKKKEEEEEKEKKELGVDGDDDKDEDDEQVLDEDEAAELDQSSDFFNFDKVTNRPSTVDPLSRSTGSISDLTVKELVNDYNYPLPYIADMIMQFGFVKPPLDINSRLGDICSGTELFAILEVVNSVPGYEVANFYYTSSVAEACEEFGWDLRAILKFCEEEGFSLPFGIRTVLRTDQIGALIKQFGEGEGA